MNDNREEPKGKKTLADALLAIDSGMAGSLDEGRGVAKDILHRDRRRIKILAWATIGLCLLMALGICLSAWFYRVKVLPQINHCEKDLSFLMNQLPKGPAPSKPDLPDTTARITVVLGYSLFIIQAIYFWGTLAFLAVMLAAAFCTVLLITAIRWATFRQIQANLSILSEQFESLRRSLQDRQSVGGEQATQGPAG